MKRELTLIELQFLALIHDVGKFYQRVNGVSPLTNEEASYCEIHAGYTYRFCKEVLGLDAYLCDVAASHHLESDDKYVKMIQSADKTSNEIDDNGKDVSGESGALKSIFAQIDFSKATTPAYFSLDSIDCATYPKLEIENEKSYRELWDAFVQELSKEDFSKGIGKYAFDRMYALMFKYMTLIPDSNVYGDGSYVSLFDHSKLTSAITGCIYGANEDNYYMYEFDVSGIQKFIFKVVEGSNTKPGIAKALRGRSSYINLLTNAITYSILNSFGLMESNIIFNTGGGGTLLLPHVDHIDDKLQPVESKVKEELYRMFSDTITFVSAYVSMDKKELKTFKQEKALELKGKLDDKKAQKYNELFQRDDFFFARAQYQNQCELCGNLIKSGSRCKICNTIEKISDFYTQHDHFLVCYDVEHQFKYATENVPLEFGYCDIYLLDEYEKKSIDSGVYMDSMNCEKLGNVRFVANLVPKNKYGNTMSFSEIVNSLTPDSCGDKKMAILKMDVDNLGAVFAFGLKEVKDANTMVLQRSLSKYLTLSRLMELFFGKFLVQICKEVTQEIYQKNPPYKNEDMFYIDYAGGDDLVIIGPAYGIVYLAKEINEKFNLYVKNENMTISGGIFIQDDKSPIRFGVQSAEDLLEGSKGLDGKNGISLIHTSIPFKQFDTLLKDVEKYMAYMNDGVISRTNLYGIMSLIRDKEYKEYVRTIPLIHYSLYRNIDNKKYIEKREEIIKDFNKIHEQAREEEQQNTLDKMTLILKLAIMFTRDKKE